MADESDWLLDEYLYPTPFSDVDPVEEILPEFLFRNEVRGPMIVSRPVCRQLERRTDWGSTTTMSGGRTVTIDRPNGSSQWVATIVR